MSSLNFNENENKKLNQGKINNKLLKITQDEQRLTINLVDTTKMRKSDLTSELESVLSNQQSSSKRKLSQKSFSGDIIGHSSEQQEQLLYDKTLSNETLSDVKQINKKKKKSLNKKSTGCLNLFLDKSKSMETNSKNIHLKEIISQAGDDWTHLFLPLIHLADIDAGRQKTNQLIASFNSIKEKYKNIIGSNDSDLNVTPNPFPRVDSLRISSNDEKYNKKSLKRNEQLLDIKADKLNYSMSELSLSESKIDLPRNQTNTIKLTQKHKEKQFSSSSGSCSTSNKTNHYQRLDSLKNEIDKTINEISTFKNEVLNSEQNTDINHFKFKDYSTVEIGINTEISMSNAVFTIKYSDDEDDLYEQSQIENEPLIDRLDDKISSSLNKKTNLSKTDLSFIGPFVESPSETLTNKTSASSTLNPFFTINHQTAVPALTLLKHPSQRKFIKKILKRNINLGEYNLNNLNESRKNSTTDSCTTSPIIIRKIPKRFSTKFNKNIETESSTTNTMLNLNENLSERTEINIEKEYEFIDEESPLEDNIFKKIFSRSFEERNFVNLEPIKKRNYSSTSSSLSSSSELQKFIEEKENRINRRSDKLLRSSLREATEKKLYIDDEKRISHISPKNIKRMPVYNFSLSLNKKQAYEQSSDFFHTNEIKPNYDRFNLKVIPLRRSLTNDPNQYHCCCCCNCNQTRQVNVKKIVNRNSKSLDPREKILKRNSNVKYYNDEMEKSSDEECVKKNRFAADYKIPTSSSSNNSEPSIMSKAKNTIHQKSNKTETRSKKSDKNENLNSYYFKSTKNFKKKNEFGYLPSESNFQFNKPENNNKFTNDFSYLLLESLEEDIEFNKPIFDNIHSYEKQNKQDLRFTANNLHRPHSALHNEERLNNSLNGTLNDIDFNSFSSFNQVACPNKIPIIRETLVSKSPIRFPVLSNNNNNINKQSDYENYFENNYVEKKPKKSKRVLRKTNRYYIHYPVSSTDTSTSPINTENSKISNEKSIGNKRLAYGNEYGNMLNDYLDNSDDFDKDESTVLLNSYRIS